VNYLTLIVQRIRIIGMSFKNTNPDMGGNMANEKTCTLKRLPREMWISAAKNAVEINPVNHPPLHRLLSVMPSFTARPERIAVVTTKYWHAKGVNLTVGFLDNPPKDLRDRILLHMNAWSSRINATFVESNGEAKVRIARTEGAGYWSYLGTDILSIASGDPTMNLEAFTMQTSDSEFHRVVRHETGHTLGCPHEHMRKELVDRIDPEKAIEYFGETQGWSPEEVRQQVLTPLEDASLLGTSHPDPNSIMCYQIPGTITKDGNPILGGLDIDEFDYEFMASIYPKADGRAATIPAATIAALERLEGERDALKKALAIFARDQLGSPR
jgi:hypothetical protein